jgi:hypothetical protein
VEIKSYAPTVWVSRSYSETWWSDLSAEVQSSTWDARREILFATCFGETILFEWVRDTVLPSFRSQGLQLKAAGRLDDGIEFKRRGEWQRLTEMYFPPDRRCGLLERWIRVPALAFASGDRPCPPYYSCSGKQLPTLRHLPGWRDLDTLIRYRNGFVHAHASRPDSSILEEESHPVPDPSELVSVRPGWAKSVIQSPAIRLYADWDAEAPSWLVTSTTSGSGDDAV